jgi:hypothetical protein
MLYAAGMIAGESLTGVILAIPIVVTGNPDAMALPSSWRLSGASRRYLAGPGAVRMLGWLLYRTASRRANDRRADFVGVSD